MAIESDLLNFGLNNGIGVLAFVMMYFMANNTIKENTKVTVELKDAIIKLSERLTFPPKNS
jgi:hypothetical protein